MTKMAKIKKILPIFFIINLILDLFSPFSKTNFVYAQSSGLPPECQPATTTVPYDEIPAALAEYIQKNGTGDSQILNDYLKGKTPSEDDFSSILNQLGSQVTKVATSGVNFFKPDTNPPNHTFFWQGTEVFFMQATTTRSIDTNGDGVADYTAIGTPLYLNKINLPSIKLNRTSASTSTLYYSIGGRIEIYDFIKIVKGCDHKTYNIDSYFTLPSPQYFPEERKIVYYTLISTRKERFTRRTVYTYQVDEYKINVEYKLVKVDEINTTNLQSKDYTFTNIIFAVTEPNCVTRKSSSFFKKKVEISCDMEALALNGQYGKGNYYRKKSSWNWGILVIGFVLGGVLGGIAFGVASGGVEAVGVLGIGIAGFFLQDIFVSAPQIIDRTFTNYFAYVDSIVDSAPFGTTVQPSGGLEQFSWSCPYTNQPGFCPPFGFITSQPPSNESQPTGEVTPAPQYWCTLTANPLSTQGAPATITFRLEGNGTLESWDGPCYLSGVNSSCSHTYNNWGRVGPFTAKLKEGPSCSTPQIRIGPDFDVGAELEINTFICDDVLPADPSSFLQRYLNTNSGYTFAPSTTYATEYLDKLSPCSETSVETQRNRPVEIIAEGTCLKAPCPQAKLQITIESISPPSDKVVATFTTPVNNIYPKSTTTIFIPDKPYDYRVEVCVVNEEGHQFNDLNSPRYGRDNNCDEQTLRVYDYMCLLGFCTQAQRDINNPSTLLMDLKYKILKTFKDTDAPCRFWRNEICRAQFGF
jgi:hypothetical protein